MGAPFISILKTTVLLKKLTPEQLEIGDGEVNKFGVSGDKKIAKKLRKLFKFQKLAKLGKKLAKNKNSSNFGITKAGPKFLTPNAKTTFNHLWLAFTKALIL